MHITPPADDYGLQKLKKNDASSEVKETGKLEPYPRVESDEEHHEPKDPLVRERRKGDRRRRERRLLKTKSTIDTRTPHERRLQERREEASEPSSPHGVDKLA